MNCFSKAAITGARKSVHPSWVKGRRVILPSIEKEKEAPQSQKDIAALTIQRAWLSHLDKRIFYLLKHTIFAAASTDAYKLMGKKKFHEQIMEDEHLSPGVQNN